MRIASVLACASLALLVTAVHASVITDWMLRERLVGSWAEGGDCRDGGLIFGADGSFAVTGTGSATLEKGTFDVLDGRLVGRSDRRDMPPFPIFFDGTTLLLGPERLDRCGKP